MRNRLRLFLAFILVPLLLACNLTNLIASGPSRAPAVPRNQSTVVPGVNVPALEGQARQLVSDFLKALKADPNGDLPKAFLAPVLLEKMQSGATVAQVTGIEGALPDYSLSAVTFNPDASQASVDVTILYQQPVNFRFHLVRPGGSWKIDQIIRLEGSESYPPTPEAVVQAFVTAYQETPETMSRYLSARRLADLPGGGAVGLLNIHGALEGMMVESAAVNPNPPSAFVTVNIRSGGEDVSRLFSLSQENGQWKIDNIDIP